MLLPLFTSNVMVFVLILLGLIIVSTITLSYMASREAERELSFKTMGLGVVEEKIRKILPVKPSPLRILLAILPPIHFNNAYPLPTPPSPKPYPSTLRY